MAINFPTSLDNFTNPSSGNTLDSPSHSLQHSDINDAVEAMQRKVGVGTAVAGSASAGQVLTISAAGTSSWSTPTVPGLVQIIPSSVAVSAGSGTVDANGRITLTNASNININDVFSSLYQNYKIFIEYSTGTSGTGVNMKLRVSGSDTSTNYNTQSLTVDGTSVGAARATGGTQWEIGITGSVAQNLIDMNLASPFATSTTAATSLSSSSFNSVYSRSYFLNHTTSASYTGFTLIPGATISGTVSIYGLR